MALLLDDDVEVDVDYVPATKAERTQSPAGAPMTATHATPVTKQPAAAGTVGGFSVKGGDGMDKMALLAYGAPTVTVTHSADSSSKGRKRALGQDSSSSTRGDRTEPKVVHGKLSTGNAQSSKHAASGAASGSTPDSRHSPSISAETSTPVTETRTRAVSERTDTGVARTLALNVDDDAERQAAPKKVTAASSPSSSTAAAAAPKQMNLSDFFSKMACKKAA